MCGLGCTTIKIVTSPTPEFGEFKPGARYVLKTEAILTSDRKISFQSPKLPDLVIPGTASATNWWIGKFRGIYKATPKMEAGRLPVGTTLEFVGILVLKDEFNPPQNWGPVFKIVDGPQAGLAVHGRYLCADGDFWGIRSKPVYEKGKIIGDSYAPWPAYLSPATNQPPGTAHH